MTMMMYDAVNNDTLASGHSSELCALPEQVKRLLPHDLAKFEPHLFYGVLFATKARHNMADQSSWKAEDFPCTLYDSFCFDTRPC
jgi:hypothetical protein